MKQVNDSDSIQVKIKDCKERTVIIGTQNRDESSYHANLQEASKGVVSKIPSIKRQYGYVLGIKEAKENTFYRKREYILKKEEKH